MCNFVRNSSTVIVSRLTFWLYINKCNRLLAFSTYIKTGIKKIYCLILFQLFLGALTCQTHISFKNIFKNIFMQLLNCKMLSQDISNKSNSIWFTTIRKQALSKVRWNYSQYLNLCPLLNPQKVIDSTESLLAAWNSLSHWKIYKLRWELKVYTDLFSM